MGACQSPTVTKGIENVRGPESQPPHAVEESPPTLDQYTSIAALLDPVHRQALYPLSGRYLIGLAEGPRPRIERRQELPEQAFFLPTVEDIEKVSKDDQPKMLIALSYRWLAQGHPDEDGHHLRIVAGLLNKHLQQYTKDGVEDAGIFWDFGSLFQKEHEGNQKQLFNEGLRASNLWYGSTMTTVWLQPHGDPKHPYKSSGWCFVEATISAAIKPSYLRRDLGNVDMDELMANSDYLDLMVKCKAGRMPPLLPAIVKQKFEKEEVRFTNNSDVKRVTTLYENFFQAISTANELLFYQCAWTDKQVEDLVQALPAFTKLQKLNLALNKIGDAGAKHLAEFLEAHTSLEELNLTMNEVGDAGALALAEALKDNTSLQMLHLGENKVGDAGTLALAEALKTNTSLTVLDLEKNKTSDEGGCALAAALRTNTSLTALYLKWNKISDEGGCALAAALRANTSLQVLNLSDNEIGDAAALALAEALKENKTLTELNLRRNSIFDQGAIALAESLKANQALTTLNLEGNKVGDAGATALADALQANGNVTVKLYGNPGYKAFQRKLEGQ